MATDSVFTAAVASAHDAALRSMARHIVETTAPHPETVARSGIRQMLTAGDLLCLTGAGISTDSGIPDYRGPHGSLQRHRPMTYQEFKYDDAARRRYWARSFVGWRQIGAAEPNNGHRVLAGWQREGRLSGLVTQNVDGLHQDALGELSPGQGGLGQAAQGQVSPAVGRSDMGGAETIIPLHGDLAVVICLNCSNTEDRAGLDQRLEEANPGYVEAATAAAQEVNPDGDVTLSEEWVQRFHMVSCLVCGDLGLKPDVVYFGETIPPARKAAVADLVERSRSLLVVGSSLAVMSGYSIALQFLRAGKEVALINGGPSRADAKATYRWRSRIAPALEWLDGQLS